MKDMEISELQGKPISKWKNKKKEFYERNNHKKIL